MPLISVIMPVYNLSAFVSDAINSCIRQTFSDFELICVNDGSTDDSAEILCRFSQKDSRVRVIEKPNEGVVIARNIGIKEASGEFLFFLDGDDSLSVDAFQLLMEEQRRSGADIVKGNCIKMSENGDELESVFLPKVNSSEEWFNYLCSTGAGSMWNHIIRKSLFESVVSIPCNLSIGEDLYALLQLAVVHPRISSISDCTYNYRINSTSVMNGYKSDANKIEPFVNRNINLCKHLLNLSQSMPRKYSDDVRLLACDKMTIYIFPYLQMIKDKEYIRLLYCDCFLKSRYVQYRIFRRSWKCYLSMLCQIFKII